MSKIYDDSGIRDDESPDPQEAETKNVLGETLTQLLKKNLYETIINTVARSVHQSINLQDVLENAVDAMSKNINKAENVSIHLVEGEEAVLKAYRGYPDWFTKRIIRIPYPKDFTWRTIVDGSSRYCADVDKDNIVGRVGREIGTKSYLSMPIRFEAKTVGVINIHSSQKNAFDEEDLNLLERVAQQIEQAFSNAHQAEVLRDSDERYRALYEDNPSMYFTVDADGNVLSVNRFGAEQLGYTVEELSGQPVLNVFYKDDKAAASQQFSKCLENPGQIFQWELRKVRKDLSILWVRETARAMQRTDGNTVVLVVCDDITDRKHAEEALRESEEKYRTLIEHSYDLIIETGVDGRFLYVSSKHKDALGYEPIELLGRSIFEHVYPDDRPAAAAEFQRAMATRSSGHAIFRFKHKNGEWRWLETTGKPFQTTSGKILGILISRDITERKAAEERLQKAHDDLELRILKRTEELIRANEALRVEVAERRRAEQRQTVQYAVARILAGSAAFSDASQKILQAICESLRWELGTIWSVDWDTDILRCIDLWHSRSAEFSEFEALSQQITFSRGIGLPGRVWASGKPAWIADIASDPSSPWAPIAAKEGLHAAFAFPIIIENDTIGVMEFFSKGVRRPDEDLLNVAATIGSQIGQFNERKRAEEELKDSRAQLRALTAHLQSVREEERTQIAREVHDELGQALTGLKIDLSWSRNQLSKIRNKALRTPLQDKAQSMFNLIDRTIEAVRRIATQLRPGVLDDLGLIAAIEWQAQDFQKRTGIECKFTSDIEDISLDQDRSTAMFRILQETLTNVARHAGATRVDIRLKRLSGKIMLEVEDNGRGIAEKEVSDSRSLGLLGMKERALIFGGEIYITSDQGKGTKVTVVFGLGE